MNPAVFDAVFTTIAKHAGTLPADLRERCDILMNNSTFGTHASYRTTDVEAVARRLELARTTLFDAK